MAPDQRPTASTVAVALAIASAGITLTLTLTLTLAPASLGRPVQAAGKRNPRSPRSGNECLELAARERRRTPFQPQTFPRPAPQRQGAGAKAPRLRAPRGSPYLSEAKAGRKELGVPVEAVATVVVVVVVAAAGLTRSRLRVTMRASPFQRPLRRVLRLPLLPPCGNELVLVPRPLRRLGDETTTVVAVAEH